MGLLVAPTTTLHIALMGCALQMKLVVKLFLVSTWINSLIIAKGDASTIIRLISHDLY